MNNEMREAMGKVIFAAKVKVYGEEISRVKGTSEPMRSDTELQSDVLITALEDLLNCWTHWHSVPPRYRQMYDICKTKTNVMASGDGGNVVVNE